MNGGNRTHGAHATAWSAALTGTGRWVWAAIGCLVLISVWALLAGHFPPMILPGPVDTGQAFIALGRDGAFWGQAVLPSLGRACAGLALAFVGGGLLALASVRWSCVEALLLPLRGLLMGLPAPVLVIVFLLWFDQRALPVICAVALLIGPVFYLAIVDGVRAVDRALWEMAQVYDLRWPTRVRHIILPRLWTALRPACRVAISNGLRVTLLTEILAGVGGLGDAVRTAQTYLQTETLFALILVILAAMAMIEGILAVAVWRRRGCR